MKTIISLICGAVLSLALFAPASADEYVRGYTRSNGTVVQPYMRTSPDSTINNNYSTAPNINPYTGREGTVAPNPYQPMYPAPAPYNPYSTP